MKVIWLILSLGLIMTSFYYVFKNENNRKKKTFYMASSLIYLMLQFLFFSPFYKNINYNLVLIFESISYFIFVPIIVLSIPSSKVRYFLWNYRLKKFKNVVTNPIIVMAVFYSAFAIIHWLLFSKNLIDFLWVFVVFHFVLLLLSILLWFPIVSSLPEIKKTTNFFKKLSFLFVNGLIFFLAYIPSGVFQSFNTGAIIGLVIQEVTIIICFGILIKKWSPMTNKIDQVDLSLQFK